MSGKGIRTKNKQAPKLVPVFVYGTLKRGFPLHEWMEDQKFVKPVKVEGYTLLSLGAYPALVFVDTHSDCGVTGELYLVEESRFKQLRVMEERVGYTTEDVSTYYLDGERGPDAKAFVFAKLEEGDVKWEQQAVKGREKMYPGRVVAA